MKSARTIVFVSILLGLLLVPSTARAQVTEIIDIAGDGYLAGDMSHNAFMIPVDDPCGMAGNVNTGIGAPVDVLFVNGSAGDEIGMVTVGTNEAIEVLFNASPSGPLGADYILYVHRGGTINPAILDTGSEVLGCTANPTPFAPMSTPQPWRCLISGLDPALRDR